jgi:AraC-like DNA-binding protein
MQIPPHPALAHVVKHYLLLNGLQPAGTVHRLFADGNTGLVFNLGNAAFGAADNTSAIHSCWLYGQIKTYHDLTLTGNINWIVVVLQPYGAYHLLGVPADELFNCFFPAEEILGHGMQEIANALMCVTQLNERVQLLDKFFLQQVNKRKEPDPVIMQAVNFIIQHEGIMPVELLLQSLYVTERTLERKFKHTIGITPKRFIEIVRLNASAKKMQQLKEKQSLAGIAHDSGYFDQAHFTKDFRRFTGFTPQQYHEQVHPLALNFLQL